MLKTLLPVVLIAACAPAILAQEEAPSMGPIIEAYGPAYAVDAAAPLPEGVEFKVAFDLSDSRGPEEINRGLTSVARFLNIHGKAGVPADHMHLAVVVHGQATKDMRTEAASGGTNVNVGLIEALLAAGVSIQVCGQSAAALDVKASELVPGIDMALSAMTAHALLQQDGYTLNPF